MIAIGWFLAGVIASGMFANSTIWTGPMTGLVDGGDLSIFVGLLVSGVGYYVQARSKRIALPSLARNNRQTLEGTPKYNQQEWWSE